MKIGIANELGRCQGADVVFECLVASGLANAREFGDGCVRRVFDRHQAADWKDGFTVAGLRPIEGADLAVGIIWYHGAVPVVSRQEDRTYTVTTPGYAA